ncbi:MAG: hypothetical protein AB7F76_11820 [Parvibaculaceae bacterium]
MFKFLDAYSVRARLFPAILAAAPAFAAFTLLISWERIALSNVIVTLALVVLIFALADFSRKLGLRVEPRLYAEMGGKPSVIMFRRLDPTIEESIKDRYRAFIASKINQVAPTVQQEATDLAMADAFYEACGTWLRSNTRDARKFPLLFNENVSYGFRRNLLGLKWSALTVNLIVVVICAALVWHRGIFDINNDLVMRTVVVLIIAAIHAIYFAFVVTKTGVKEAARKYGRELILSTETLISAAPIPAGSKGRIRKATR